MHKRFLITDSANIEYGTLTYETDTRTWHIEINAERTWADTPLSLAIYIKNGKYSLDKQQSLAWVRDRLLPPNRQNIYQVLLALDLPEYDEYELLNITCGNSPNDNLFLVKLEDC